MSVEHLARLADTLARWVHRTDRVRAGFWFGGVGYGRLRAGSDLDVALILAESCDLATVVGDLEAALVESGERVRYRAMDPRAARAVLFCAPEPTKIDLVFGRSTADLAWLAAADDVPAPRLSAIRPLHEPDLRDLERRANLPLDETAPDRRRDRAELEIDKFLIAFDACVAARARGQRYAFYFDYNLALGRLARLVQLARLGHRHLYRPAGLVETLLDPDEQAEWERLGASLDPGLARAACHRLGLAFAKAVDEAVERLGVRRDPDLLRQLVGEIDARPLE